MGRAYTADGEDDRAESCSVATNTNLPDCIQVKQNGCGHISGLLGKVKPDESTNALAGKMTADAQQFLHAERVTLWPHDIACIRRGGDSSSLSS